MQSRGSASRCPRRPDPAGGELIRLAATVAGGLDAALAGELGDQGIAGGLIDPEAFRELLNVEAVGAAGA